MYLCYIDESGPPDIPRQHLAFYPSRFGYSDLAENGEEELFDLVFKRADRKGAATVGVRHFTNQEVCICKICDSHKPKSPAATPATTVPITVTIETGIHASVSNPGPVEREPTSDNKDDLDKNKL